MGLLTAERIKLASTRSPWWCSVIVVLLGVAFAALIAGVSTDATAGVALDVETALSGIGGPGLMVVMIMAALAITTEYRFSTIRSSFLAAPGRFGLLGAKAVVVSAVSVVVVALAAALSYLVAKVVAGSGDQVQLALDSAERWRNAYGLLIVTPLLVVLALAVGVLLRQSAGVIAVVVLWPNVIEPIISSVGQTGRDIYAWLPFANMNHFLGYEGFDFHWGPWGGLIYFAVFTVIVAGAGLYVVHRRDA